MGHRKRPALLAAGSIVALLALACVPHPPGAGGSISIDKYTRLSSGPATGGLCETLDRPAKLALTYRGGSVVDSGQAPDKVDVLGDPGTTSPVRLIASSDDPPTAASTYTDTTVSIGDGFVIDAGSIGDVRLPADVHLTVRSVDDNTLLQSIEFHTSCSQPLALGDRYGSVELTGYTDVTGSDDLGEDADTPPGPAGTAGETVLWTYLVTNTGTRSLSGVSVVDDAGTAGDPADDFTADPVLSSGGTNLGDDDRDGVLDPGEKWRYSSTGFASLGQYSNLGRVTAAVLDDAGADTGETVSAQDPSHYTADAPADLCAAFDSPVRLTLAYRSDSTVVTNQLPDRYEVVGDPAGASPVRVTAAGRETPDAEDIYFHGIVSTGESFVVDAVAGGDTRLGADLYLTVRTLQGDTVLQSVGFHTSCSQPLGLGDRYGTFELLGYTDVDGRGV